MPFPSTGCQTCKIRRIKCDEATPTCQRCKKSRRICLASSLAKQACFSIHIENCYASGETKRPRGPRSSLNTLRLHVDLQTRALSYFQQTHFHTLKDVPDVAKTLSECMNSWTVSGRSCLMVDLALSSMSLVVFSRTQHHPPAAVEASSKYCRLLSIMQQRIEQMGTTAVDEPNIDAYLLAITLMGRYEGATASPSELRSKDSFASLQSYSHHDGAMALLKYWNDKLSSSPATLMIRQTRRGLIKSWLLRSLALPEWIRDGSRFGEQGRDLTFDRIFIRIVGLHNTFLNHRNNCGQILDFGEINSEAKAVDTALQDWATQLPTSWHYQHHMLTESGPWPQKHFCSPIVYSYANLGYAAVWSQYFALRILVNSTRLKLLVMNRADSSVDFTCDKELLNCTIQLKYMTDSLASTIPFCLERFKVTVRSDSPTRQNPIRIKSDERITPYKAYFVIWPLTIASIFEGVDVRQQLWFRAELATLGRVTGTGILECAETDTWPVFLMRE